DCAPLFEERFAMNQQAVVQSIPLVECAMYDLEAQVTTIIPKETPCLACLYPDQPPMWTREFPVFGAVSGMIGCIAVMEAIKIIAGFGHTLKSKMLNIDLRSMKFQIIDISPASDCHICGHL
ncbi:MAG: ThiF family adenylyltransferase, partial [Candidatus Poribacteria bacterium]|nr:ThiF family adenylyltransferase [Candidatus Poribacteria bacterium]